MQKKYQKTDIDACAPAVPERVSVALAESGGRRGHNCDQLAEAAALDDDGEPTPEEAYLAALDGEQRWDLEPDGTLTPATDDPAREWAWRADSRRSWDRP